MSTKEDYNEWTALQHDVPVFIKKFGDSYALLEGGIAANAKSILKKLKDNVNDLSKIKYWFISHSHYDHVGSIPYILPHLKNVTLYGSEGTFEKLKKESVQKVVSQLNQDVFPLWNEKNHDLNFESLYESSIQILTEGDIVTFENQKSLEVFETPGHSACLLSYLDHEEKLLFVSDSLGERVTDNEWTPLAFQNFELYEHSIEKIKTIPYEKIALGHYEVLSGFSASIAPTQAMNSFQNFRKTIEREMSKNGSISQEFIEQNFSKNSKKCEKFVPYPLYIQSFERMVALCLNNISKKMEAI